MTSTEQHDAMKDAFLMVEIKQDGKTILQKTLNEYNIMKEFSIRILSCT